MVGPMIASMYAQAPRHPDHFFKRPAGKLLKQYRIAYVHVLEICPCASIDFMKNTMYADKIHCNVCLWSTTIILTVAISGEFSTTPCSLL